MPNIKISTLPFVIPQTRNQAEMQGNKYALSLSAVRACCKKIRPFITVIVIRKMN